jgi:hypothetical protein
LRVWERSRSMLTRLLLRLCNGLDECVLITPVILDRSC